MVNYADAKIYRVVDNSTGLQYIGSTTQSLAKRMYRHRNDYKRWVELGRPHGRGSHTKSVEVFETGNEVRIELIEQPEVTCKEELTSREGYWIRELDCVNRCVAGRTRQEYYEANREEILARTAERYKANKEEILAQQREYYETNKERLRARKKEQNDANREEIRTYQKEYYETNKEEIRRRRKEYREANKEEIRRRRKERDEANKEAITAQRKKWKQECIRCEVCGATTTKGNYAQHKKAKYCLEAAAAKAEQGL